MAITKKPVIIDNKFHKIIIKPKIGEKVFLFLKGEEPIRGELTNITTWNGEEIYEVTYILNGEENKKWGSIKQIKKIIENTEEEKNETI